MTGRTSAVLAGSALCIAVIAIAVRPLLPHPHATAIPSVHATPTPAPQPADLGSIAVSAATHDLACPAPRPAARSRGCGRLDVTRAQSSCATDSRCQVELIGTLRTTAQVVPIALTVTLTGARHGWRVVEVAS
jgi:hypothetical protein